MKAVTLIMMLAIAVFSTRSMAETPEHKALLRKLHLPDGFKISIFADDAAAARSLALGDNGVVYIGSRQGRVIAVRDSDGDGVADKRYLLADHLYIPNGLAFKDGALYVAEVNRIIRFDNIGDHLDNPPKPVVVYDKFPSEKHHGWKYLRFGPDGKLYTAVGAPCNICEPDRPIFASLLRLDADGGNLEILASGIRNTVGFDWQPETGQLFFNDNGRDYLGDDSPPDELNLWSRKGENFGYPYCHGGTIPDPQFGANRSCGEFTPPVWKYKAHIAPLGMRFYTGSQFPEEYRQQLFVAQHGSWNRSQPQGYQIALVQFKNGLPYRERTFIEGWLDANGDAWGRPVDILQTPDGGLLISDDELGVVYKVEYRK